MTYEQALEFVCGLVNFERKPPPAGTMRREVTLDRVRELAEAIGNPASGLKCVHIAGTKGKGSTAAFCESILRSHRLKTGLFTSPHLLDIRERIKLDGELIDKELFARQIEKLKPFVEKRRKDEQRRATYFETMTHAAFLAFAQQGVEASVIEVGMGGRLDATNIITPVVSVIMPIGRDHVMQLGVTTPLIAREKAGIIKEGVPVVADPGPQEALEVIEALAAARGSRLLLSGRDFSFSEDACAMSVSLASGVTVSGIRVPLPGRHQRANATAALQAAELFLEAEGRELDPHKAASGIARTRWPGRIQKVGEKPAAYVDGAHNVQSMEVLVRTMRELHPGKALHFVFACSSDKDVTGMVEVLRREASAVAFTESSLPRAMPAAELLKLFGEKHSPPAGAVVPAADAFRQAVEAASGTGAVVVATGSLYLVGDILRIL